MTRRALPARLALATAGSAALAGAGLRFGPVVVERRYNRVHRGRRIAVSDRARALHETLFVADLHADSLLWGRNLLRPSRTGHLDIPRLIEGGVALQVFAATTQVPRRANLDRNDGSSDDVILLALLQRWPTRTWRSRLERALFIADRAHGLEARSDGRFKLIETAADIDAVVERRMTDRQFASGVLGLEGAHALEGDVAGLDLLVAAGYRLLGLAHFFDNEFAGSAHGVGKIGLTTRGRELVARAEEVGVVIDLAHASERTIEDTLLVARRPVVVSHTGVRGVADNIRNLSDDQLRGIAANGGVVGIGFWPTASGGRDVESIARSIAHATAVAGQDHVALGSDWDGAVPVPFDATGIAGLTDALLAEGLAEDAIRSIMGGNVVRLLRGSLPGSGPLLGSPLTEPI